MRQWWATRAAMQAKADAARAWAEHVDTLARTQHAPSAQASRAAGLVRALTRPEGLAPTTLSLHIDPISGWARTMKDELLPPSTLAASPAAPRPVTCTPTMSRTGATAGLRTWRTSCSFALGITR